MNREGKAGELGAEGIEVVLIHRDPPCKKCLKARDAVEKAAEVSGVLIDLKEVIVGTPEADMYGVVVPPMVLVGGKTVCAGFPPLVSTLANVLKETAAAGPQKGN